MRCLIHNVKLVCFCPACRGSIRSRRKARASRQNGKLGGRPRKAMTTRFIAIAGLSLLCVGALGCSEFREKPKPQAPVEAAPPNRYELHDVRNGNTLSTALLDKQTGRVWALSGTKGNAMVVFEQVRVFPPPDLDYWDSTGFPRPRAPLPTSPPGWQDMPPPKKEQKQ